MEHGLSKTRLYSIYSGMKQRCYNPNNQHYQWSGGKGITICDEWMGENGLQNFIEWSLNHGYEEHLTIDRKENNKGYSPENCQWITLSVNSSKAHMSNSKSNIIIGEKNDVREYINLCRVKRGNMSEAELARRTGQTPQNMNNKHKRNTFKVSELEKIAEALDAELKILFIDKETGEPII